MRATRRFWGVGALAAFLALFAIVLAEPVLLAGTATLAAWLLTAQYRFLTQLDAALEELTVEQTLSRDRVPAAGSTTYRLSVSRPADATLSLAVTAAPPTAATVTGDRRTVSLAPGQRAAALDIQLSWPVAGQFTCDQATLAVTDPSGLLTERLPAGTTPSITVEPRRPRDVHVGEGGERIAAAYGEHESGRLGSGFDPAEIREYVPGDPAGRIAWKATARLGDPYVREYESETDRQTVLLFDHRASIGTGPAGATKLEYLRHVALAFVGSARELSDPLGCYTIDDEGLTSRYPPAATDETYARIRSTLEGLEVTAADASEPPEHAATNHGVDHLDSRRRRSPARARAVATELTEASTFDSTLRPFFADTSSYVRRIRGDPLAAIARREIGRLDGAVWTVILTDDSRPERLRQAITVARHGENRVLVFLTPTALFEPGGLADLESAYDRYVDFEDYRRELARLPGVSAFEVAPGDRLAAVLATGRRRRANRRARRA